ncbi:MAG: TMEM175 family protein [Microthrixaceae bacterium]
MADDAEEPTTAAEPSGKDRRALVWHRGEEPEFGRVVFFTDAVYAIALTLLVLDLHLPAMTGAADDPGVMWTALGDLGPKFVSFAVAFILISRYWIANHGFFTGIQRIDRPYLAYTVLNLAGVAFLPFPTSLVGEYVENPVSGVMFALTLAFISTTETLLLMHAHRARLMRSHLSDAAYRWQVLASAEPAVMFVVTIPLAFIHPWVMLVIWIPWGFVAGHLVDRRKPSGAY